MDHFTRIIPELRKLFGDGSPSAGYHWLKATYLFGSTLTLAGADEYSDIDVAVFVEPWALNEHSYIDKLKKAAIQVGVAADILKLVEFHGYDVAELDKPTTFVEREILERGSLLYWKTNRGMRDIRSLVSGVIICPGCKRHFKDCTCPIESHTRLRENLFVVDTRYFQILKDVDFVVRELRNEVKTGHFDQLELVLVLWHTLLEFLLNNVKYRIVDRFDRSRETDIQRLTYLYGKTHDDFFKRVCGAKWMTISDYAVSMMGGPPGTMESANVFRTRLTQAIEYRNAYIHGRAAYLNGEFVHPRKVNMFCSDAVTDEKTLFAPTIEYVTNIYRLFNPPENKAEKEKLLSIRYPKLRTDVDLSADSDSDEDC
jgi:predicted nucleotidyltransferase